jgi:hypothetical protein
MTTAPGNDDDPSGDGSGQSEDTAKDREAKRSIAANIRNLRGHL